MPKTGDRDVLARPHSAPGSQWQAVVRLAEAIGLPHLCWTRVAGHMVGLIGAMVQLVSLTGVFATNTVDGGGRAQCQKAGDLQNCSAIGGWGAYGWEYEHHGSGNTACQARIPVAGTTVRPSTRTKFMSIDNNSLREPGELIAQVPTHKEMRTMGNLLRETVVIEATSLIAQELDVVLCSACLC